MLSRSVKEIVQYKSEIDATQIAEVLWLSSFMTASKSQQHDKEDKTKEKKLESSVKTLHLPKEIKHTVIINAGQKTENEEEQSLEWASNCSSSFSTYIPKKEVKEFKLEKEFTLLRIKTSQESNEFDEEKSADYMATTDLFEPFYKNLKLRSNHFSLLLVIDTNSSMFLWDESIKKFVEGIEKVRVFKRMEICYVDSSENTASFKRKQSTTTIDYDDHFFKKQNRLILTLSDVVGKSWRSNQMFQVLEFWSDYAFVTLISMLPQSMWQKTPLRQGVSLFVSSKKVPVKNSELESEYSLEYENNKIQNELNIPIIPLVESAFGHLSNLLVAKKESWLDARLFQNLEDNSAKTELPLQKKEPKERVEHFFTSVNESARLLAIYCSVLPLNKTIIEAVIYFKSLGNIDAFAEFYFGGLIDKSFRSDIVEYEFFDGVRQELMEYISVEEVKSLFYILNNVASKSLGLNGTLVDLLFSYDKKSLKLSDKEKEIVKLLKSILKHKGTLFKKELNILREKQNTIHPKTNTYQMGSNDGHPDEKPVHQITFDYDFAIAKTPVTFEEYDLYCEAKGIEKPNDEGWGRGKRPVINVSWHDATHYCKWLSEQTGHNYRLPTEAEWEYTCRAGTTTRWSFADDEKELDKYAWYIKNSDSKIHPVGKKLPNPWGLYDMHGNVLEWCQDDWVSNYEKTPRDGTAYKESKDSDKVVRGGSWFNFASNTRSANRSRYNPTNRNNNRGFRILRTLP